MAARTCFSKFTDEKFLRTVPMGLFRELLAPHNENGRLGLDLEELSPEALKEFFLGADDTMPDGLLGDMHMISKMATDTGMHVIVAHGQTRGVTFERPDADENEDPMERIDPKWLALHCFLDHRDIFDAAHQERIYERQSTFDEYTGKGEGLLDISGSKIKELEEELGSYFMLEYQGPMCEIMSFEEENEQKFLINHGRFWKVDVGIKDNKEAPHSWRPLVMSVVEYDPMRGVLRINAKTDKDRVAITKAFGKVLFQDEDYFAAGDTVTLAPLLDPDFEYDWTWDSEAVESVAFIELQIRRSEERKSSIILKSQDVIEDLRGMRDIDVSLLSVDDMVYAKVLFRFKNSKARAKTVRIKPKNKIVIGRASHVSTIHKHLRRMGILKDVR